MSAEGAGFGQLEVTQVDVVDGRAVLLFSCLDSELSAERRAAGERGGIWAVNAAGLTGPYDIRGAYRIADQKLYSGRIVRDRSGSWVMLAFRHTLDSGAFVGEIIDPLPIGWKGNTLSFTGPSAELSARVSARALGGPRS